MRVLVTGGAGFIGSNFVRLVNRLRPDVEVRILDDLSTGDEANLVGLNAELITAGVEDMAAVLRAVDGVDSIVHLGALGSVPRSVKDPVSSHVANLTGTLNVLEAARTVGAQVIFASSSSVYGANTKLPKTETDWVRPMSPYAATKLGAEAYVLAYGFSYGLDTLAFRFFNVYGPYQAADHVYAAVVPKFVSAALSDEPLIIHGDGEQSRDFTHVDTVCAALWSAVERRLSLPDPINLAFGTSTTINELTSIIGAAVARDLVIERAEARTGDVRASKADGLRLRQHFPELVPIDLQRGIASTVEWFVNNT